jgi:trk system potassium uptake protein
MKIIIIGCGRTGAGLARTLGLGGHAVTVVDPDPASFERLGPSFKGQSLAGVGFDRDVLVRAGIERADALAAVTASDEVNVVTARVARQMFKVPRVVAHLYDPRKAEIYKRLGLQTVTPITWGINRIADMLCYSGLDTVASLGNGAVDIVDAEVPRLLAGRPVADVTVHGEINVGAITRRGQTFLPSPDTIFQEGDLAHFVLLAASADRLRQLLALG